MDGEKSKRQYSILSNVKHFYPKVLYTWTGMQKWKTFECYTFIYIIIKITQKATGVIDVIRSFSLLLDTHFKVH